MSTSNTAPAGWYPDPNDARQQRWWDGTQWTDHVAGQSPAERPSPTAPVGTAERLDPAAPVGTAERPDATAPAGTDWRTPWIWLVLILPLLPAIPALFIDWPTLFTIDPDTLEPDPASQFAILTSPAYWLSAIGGWVAYALAVFFAYLDWKELRRRGVPSPFHWAWTFLSSYVYGIGRGVVVQRRTGRGIAVMWVAIGILALSIALGIVISVLAVAAVVAQVPMQ